jgi:hypothetical protein
MNIVKSDPKIQNEQRAQRIFNEKLIEILNSYRSCAEKEHKNIDFNRLEKYYRGNFKDIQTKSKSNNFNIIKLLVDTKSTFVLDNHITTSVIAKVLNFSNENTIKDMQDMADIYEDTKNVVFENNKIKTLYKKIVKRGIKTNIGIAKIYWDQEESELGDIKIKEINPVNFYPDPTAEDIQSASYVFLKNNYSIINLKKKYPQFINEIDKLEEAGDKDAKSTNISEFSGIITSKNDGGISQIYAKSDESLAGIKTNKKTITIWECYIKDDSIFIDDPKDKQVEKEVKQEAKLRYPNGRLIIYAGKNLILEDKPIDYPFGFPFSFFYENPGDAILCEGGTVNDLIFIQDRLNKAYERLIYLIGKYLSIVVIDKASGINKTDIIREDVLALDAEALSKGQMPQILTNNTIAEVQNIMKYIEDLKNNAKEIARVNDQMISGKRPDGVTSGDMVIALNESPMTSIREIQGNFEAFLLDLSDKVLVLIQKYYNLERIVQISSGKTIQFPLRDETGAGSIKEYEINQGNPENEEIINVIKELKSNPSDYKFKTEIIAGTELPKSRTQYAQLTTQLVNMGLFGNITDLKVKKIILDAIDYPNRRAIMKELEAKNEEASKILPVEDTIGLIDKISFSFKDLELFPEAQRKVLIKLGLLEEETPPPNPEISGELPVAPQGISTLPTELPSIPTR